MPGPLLGDHRAESSSSPSHALAGNNTAEDMAGDERLDNALLADDPLDEGNGKMP